MIAANSARGQDNAFCAVFKGAYDRAAGRLTARCAVFCQNLTRNPFDGAVFNDQTGGFMAIAKGQLAGFFRAFSPAYKGGNNAGASAPGDMKPRHRIAVAGGQCAAALGPAHHAKPAHAKPAQPAAHFAGSKFDIGFGHLTRQRIFWAIKLRCTHPIGQRQIITVTNSHAALLGGIDHKQAAQGPKRLTSKALRAFLIK